MSHLGNACCTPNVELDPVDLDFDLDEFYALNTLYNSATYVGAASAWLAPMPIEFEQLAPESGPTEVIVECRVKYGATVILPYPRSILYADSI